MKDLVEGAMSLYNTIDIEVNKKENTYTDGDAKVKEILNNEQPLFIQDDDEVGGMLFQYLNIGYALCGVKYIDMLLNNKALATTAIGYALQTLNKNMEELIQYREKYGALEDEGNEPISIEELKGIKE